LGLAEEMTHMGVINFSSLTSTSIVPNCAAASTFASLRRRNAIKRNPTGLVEIGDPLE